MPIPLLYNYLLTAFLGAFLKILGLFVGLFFLLDGADHIKRLTKELSTQWVDVITLLLLRMPEYLFRFLPAIALLATLAVLFRLSRQNEITIMRASGVSIYNILIPFLLGGMIVALAQMLIQDQIIPRTNQAAEHLMARLQNTQVRDLWLRDGNRILHAKKAWANRNVLQDVTVFVFDDQFRLSRRIVARKAEIRNGEWHIFDGKEFTFDSVIEAKPFFIRPWEIKLQKEQLNRAQPQPRFLSMSQLTELANRLEKEGYDATTFWVALHRKLANPVTTLSAILLAFPFSFRLHRYGGGAPAMLLGLIGGFALFVVVDLSTALGDGGRLPPFMAAWAPVVFFSGLGGFLLMRIEEVRG